MHEQANMCMLDACVVAHAHGTRVPLRNLGRHQTPPTSRVGISETRKGVDRPGLVLGSHLPIQWVVW